MSIFNCAFDVIPIFCFVSQYTEILLKNFASLQQFMKKRTMKTHVSAIFLSILALTACQTVGDHRQSVRNDSEDRLTVGTVQREIRIGMTTADVASVLGSPNMVSTDEERREVWVYDKIATEHIYSSSSSGINVLVFGFGSGAAGGFGGGGSTRAGAASTSQRTLTVIIKFDHQSKVRDFAYHTSRF